MRRVIWFSALITGLMLLAWPIISVIRNPLPPGRIVVASGGSGGLYDELAQSYKQELAKYGVELVSRPDIDGFNTLKALVVDQDSGIMAGFVKGGFVGGQQGRLATPTDNEWYKRDMAVIRSVGRLFVEPLWVFMRKGETISNLRQLAGKRVFVGSKESGARKVVEHLLAANGITKANATLIEQDLDADAKTLETSDIDVAFLLLPPEAPRIQKLLRNPNLRLLNFEMEADAYVNRFPFLSKVVLHEGSVEFAPTTPEKDVTLLTTKAALIVHKDLHPALTTLLTYVVFHNPKPGHDKTGEPILFFKAGEFPTGADSEFETPTEAQLVQKTHELPPLLRIVGPINARLGVPFAVTAFISEHGSQVLVALVPLLGIALPLMRIAPAAYNYAIRRRLLIWYRRLKSVERTAHGAMDLAQLAAAREELDDIDQGVSEIRVPLAFSSQLYDLHMHINVVRQRLISRTASAAAAAGAPSMSAARQTA